MPLRASMYRPRHAKATGQLVTAMPGAKRGSQRGGPVPRQVLQMRCVGVGTYVNSGLHSFLG